MAAGSPGTPSELVPHGAYLCVVVAVNYGGWEQNQGQNAIDGLDMLVTIIQSEKKQLLDQMHFEVRTFFGVFMALVRSLCFRMETLP